MRADVLLALVRISGVLSFCLGDKSVVAAIGAGFIVSASRDGSSMSNVGIFDAFSSLVDTLVQ